MHLKCFSTRALPIFAIFLSASLGCADAGIVLNEKSISVGIGTARKLEATPTGKPESWKSGDPLIAQVLGNGWVIGLQPGMTTIGVTVDGARAECLVTVNADTAELCDPTTLKQFPDNRKFTANGRVCFGSELNGRAVAKEDRLQTRRNRIINPKPLARGEDLDWEVKEETEFFDGSGRRMGTVAPTVKVGARRVPSAKFNYGMSKLIHGRMCAYAFTVRIKPDEKLRPLLPAKSAQAEVIAASGWLPVESVVDQGRLLDRLKLGHLKLPRLPLEAVRYRITGGDSDAYATKFGELSIVSDVVSKDDTGSVPVPSHYLRRPSGVVNIMYSVPGFGLGGQSLDSILIDSGAVFRPAVGAKQFVRPTYYPLKHPHQAKASGKTMTFIYGAVEVKGSETVYGWVAKEALTLIK